MFKEPEVVRLLTSSENSEKSEESVSTIIERASNRLCCNEPEMQVAYIDTRFLSPISNMRERLLSITANGMKIQRKGLLLTKFDSQLFLYMNYDHWGIEDVKNIAKVSLSKVVQICTRVHTEAMDWVPFPPNPNNFPR